MRKYNFNDLLMTLFIIIIFCSIMLVYNAGFAFFDYAFYKLNSEKYDLVIGKVINFRYVDILPARGSLDKGAIYYTQVDVLYELDGEKKFKYNIKSFCDKQKDDSVLLAIKDNMILRGEPYNFTVIDFFCFFCIVLCLFMIISIKIYSNKQRNIIKNNSNFERLNYEKELEENSVKTIFQKQKYILKMVGDYSIKRDNNDILEVLQEHNILLNEECQWYVDNGIYIKGILINEFRRSISACVLVTEKMRKRGMGADYYVIEEFDNFCLCCNEKCERVFSYSENIGITNTIYFDFYDYVLKKINEMGN